MVDLPAPDRPVSQTTHGWWPFSALRACGRDIDLLPMHVGRPTQPEVQQADTDGGVAESVDDDEATHVAIGRVRVEREWRGRS